MGEKKRGERRRKDRVECYRREGEKKRRTGRKGKWKEKGSKKEKKGEGDGIEECCGPEEEKRMRREGGNGEMGRRDRVGCRGGKRKKREEGRRRGKREEGEMRKGEGGGNGR